MMPPTIERTDIRCPRCNSEMVHIGNAYGCQNYHIDKPCGWTWQPKDGKLIPATEATRQQWQEERGEQFPPTQKG